ncbi:MAG: DUF5906 domain-containing protein [Chromatiaceae bacterium]|nr:DUF5906 domain-containing protein [Chromatiaceae bacterium]
MSDYTIRATLWRDRFARNREELTTTWPELCKLIDGELPSRAKEQCRLIKLATFGDTATPQGALRHDANLLEVYGIEADYDAGLVAPTAAIDQLEQHQLRALVYESWSSSAAAPRWRVLAPLAKPIRPADRLRYAEALNGMLGGILANETAALSQSYYIGRPIDQPRTVSHTFSDPKEGFCLDEIDDIDTLRSPFSASSAGPAPSRGGSEDWLAQLLQGTDLHNNAVRLVGRLITRGADDAMIRTLFANWSPQIAEQRGAERTAALMGGELDRMIRGARSKGYHPTNSDDSTDQGKKSQTNTSTNPLDSLDTRDQPSRNPLETLSQPSRMEWGSLIDEVTVQRKKQESNNQESKKQPDADQTDQSPETKHRRKIESLAAEVVANALRDDLAWDSEAGCWSTWQGSHWQTHVLPAPADTLLAHAVKIGCGDHGYRPSYLTGISLLIQRLDLLARPARPEGVVPFRNGLLDLNTGELYAPTPDRALDWCLPHDFDPKATCPNIRDWLLRATDHDPETVELLRAWLAALVRGLPLQKFVVLIGRGGTGKSTFTRLAKELIGDANVAISTLRDLENNRFECAKLVSKRLTVINEAGRQTTALNVLKALTGDDPLPLERKHQQQQGSFRYDGLVLMATNEDLQSTDATSGLERRRVTVRFPTTATEAERADWHQRGGEAGVLHAEIPGLINWLLELDATAIRRRFDQLPERVKNENLLGMAAGNPVADWLINNTVADPDAYLQIGKLSKDEQGRPLFEHTHDWAYQNYRSFCLETGRDRPASIVKFREIVTDIARDLGRPVEFIEHATKRTRILKGIRLISNPLEIERVREGCERGNPLIIKNSRGSRGFDELLSEKNPDAPDQPKESHLYVV